MTRLTFFTTFLNNTERALGMGYADMGVTAVTLATGFIYLTLYRPNISFVNELLYLVFVLKMYRFIYTGIT
jgi:hypothetical protein